MGELTTVELRKLAGCVPFITPEAGAEETAAALRWAADRIDHLEGFIEAYEREQSEQRHKALDQLTAEAQAMGFYDSQKPGGSKETERD